MSTTAAKALSLLDHFTEEEPEFGLSELARRAQGHKASVHRLLGALVDAGLIEQNTQTRRYRLGSGLLRLAQIREATSPIASIVHQSLDRLMAETGETAHGSVISGNALATIGIRESTRSTRVSLVTGEVLPLHSTASGMVVLATGSEELTARILAAPLARRTIFTITDPEELGDKIATVRAQGYAVSEEENEDDVFGIAAPFFDSSGLSYGALAVAAPCHRMSDALRAQIIIALAREAKAVTQAIGGHMPPAHVAALRRTLKTLQGPQAKA